MPYEVVKRKDGGIEFKVNDKKYAPPEISARVLQKLKQMLKLTWVKR